MTNSRAPKPLKRARQRVTRAACEPCREKRAKCNGENPCGRCKIRHIDCHFTQRTWMSKRSLQDEADSLREQVHRRERLLDAICGPDASGEEIHRVLRSGALTYDQAYGRLRGTSEAPGMNNDTLGEGHNDTGSRDCETCSPSIAHSTMLSSATGDSPFSLVDCYLGDDSMSQPNTMSEEIPQQPNDLQQPVDPMQSFSWASHAPDVNPSSTLFSEPAMGPSAQSGIAGDYPTIIDPLLWPPIDSSDPLGQPFLNSWTGLMPDPTDAPKAEIVLPCGGWC